MLNWLTRHGLKTRPVETGHPIAPAQEAPPAAGTYRALRTFLEHRYSNTVVLTFGQIEDLLGFALPERARTDGEWWTGAPGTAELQHSRAWTQAAMTARPNLLARNVLFERAP